MPIPLNLYIYIRAPDGLGWAEKNKPTGFFIFYWPSPPWAGPRIGSPAQALASGNQPMGAHGLNI